APAPAPVEEPAPAAASAASAPAAADPAAEVDVDALVREIVAEKTGYSADILESDMGIEADLGIDSIKRVEILGAIGERFPGRAPFSPEEVAELRTLGDIVEALRGQTTGTSRERRASSAADDEEAAPGIRRSTVRWAPIAGPDLPVTVAPRVVRVRDGSASGIAPRLRDELRAAGHDVRIDGDTPDRPDDADAAADLVLIVGPRPDADATETLVDALDAVRAFAVTVADRAATGPA
ncbi:phosphopantetheine-binding protein, partial [Clavibacter michiganensis]